MFKETDTETSPWNVIRSDDKRRARIAAMRLVLSKMDYDEKTTILSPRLTLKSPALRQSWA